MYPLEGHNTRYWQTWPLHSAVRAREPVDGTYFLLKNILGTYFLIKNIKPNIFFNKKYVLSEWGGVKNYEVLHIFYWKICSQDIFNKKHVPSTVSGASTAECRAHICQERVLWPSNGCIWPSLTPSVSTEHIFSPYSVLQSLQGA